MAQLYIDRNLRELLFKQEETLILSAEKCSYKGSVYIFDQISSDEAEAIRLDLLKKVNKKEFFIAILERLKFKL